MRSFILVVLAPLSLFSEIPQRSYDEKTICFLEEHIPEIAEAALKLAYWEALASGSCVLIVKDEILIEVAPDGTERIIKELPCSTPVIPGKYIQIKIEKHAQ